MVQVVWITLVMLIWIGLIVIAWRRGDDNKE